jgi:hypothetical protein
MGQSTPINKLHSSIPRVLCPRCGNQMRLAEINPGTDGAEQVMRFDCDCDLEYRMLCVVWNEQAKGDQTPGIVSAPSPSSNVSDD